MVNKKTIAGALALGALGLTGCAAFDVAAGRLGDRAESLVGDYCELPRSVRHVVRWETNKAVQETGTVVIGCQGEPDYTQLRQAFVEPLSDSTIDALIAEVLQKGAVTLPDGTKLKLIVEEGEQENE